MADAVVVGAGHNGLVAANLLADPDSGYITGEMIDCNGGLYM
jgi:ribulose 1,5-bisphosphate synthetase/thiazole synthase